MVNTHYRRIANSGRRDPNYALEYFLSIQPKIRIRKNKQALSNCGIKIPEIVPPDISIHYYIKRYYSLFIVFVKNILILFNYLFRDFCC